jgi:UDP-N-acetylmuramate--alanine ligase
MYPTIAVVTGVEADHLDTYGDIESLKQAFVDFLQRVPFYGLAVLCIDDAILPTLMDQVSTTVITYGVSKGADYCATDIKTVRGRSRFTVIHNNEELGDIDLPLIGHHNIRNALAAIAVSSEMEIPFDIIQMSLAGFKGIKRRFEYLGTERGITLIDDYAHHPTEISATLQAVRDAGFKRVVAIFQPHLYTRTRDFCDAFAESLADADYSIITGIYKARDEVQAGISGSLITDKILATGIESTIYIEEKFDIAENLVPLLQQGDCVILMGAGDIWEIGKGLLERIKNG